MTKQEKINEIWKKLLISHDHHLQKDAGELMDIAERMVADHNHPAWKIILKI